ncbi:phosphoglucomutase/phosphomannomutase PgmG [Emcibacter nanhaiensis]|uniref:Phosphomannomutase/phosphoglucomutase n=1 Tax=Emcibacter nanhaiensis TaxID=1505037 RepID=A0A501PRW9_9PROT|nr:phosphomannomutase/phosphoglucomutase [Emcibacter nanhaiensis]TPD63183.1 phosphomannomutase/phosphoglucomutase [Emcibacter nanhaiensis]
MAHSFNPTVLREYDIRGIVGDTIKEQDAEALGRAFGTLVRRNGGRKVCVGYDGRLSSPSLEKALVSGLLATGLDVIRVGRGPTPMLYYSVFELDADGGIMITGSHNPPDYNGFKMMIGKESCFGERIQEIGRLSAAGDLESGEGTAADEEIFDRYVERILSDVDMESLARADLTVAWDTGNGAAGEVVEAVINRLPGEHILINGDIDGTFPAHHPDPTVEENLVQLQDCVAEEQCDLGLAFDGDGDRIGAVDSAGRIVWGDQLLAILSREVLEDQPGATIIADVKASQVLFDHIAASGGKPLMWKTGHSLIKSKMHETGAPLAGEMSGHIFFKHKFYGFDDAIYVALRLLNEVARTRGGLKALKDKLPQVINTPELRFPCSEERKFDIVPEVHKRLKEAGADVNDTDGVRVNTEDGWWLLRPSNTQDVLVARCEGRDEAALERLKEALADQLRASGIEPPAM